MTSGLVRASALGLSLLASSAALAGQGDCDRIGKAMLAVADQPAVRQSVINEKKEPLMSSILLKDAMFMQEEPTKPWKKAPIDAAKRRTIAEQALKMLPLSDCESRPGETTNSEAVDVFVFSQPDPLSGGAKTSSTIWIAKTDGLPRRMLLTDGSTMLFEYGDFKAPTP